MYLKLKLNHGNKEGQNCNSHSRNNMSVSDTHALYYSFSVTLFLLVTIERVVNACTTLVARLVWGTRVTSGGDMGRMLGTIVQRLNDEGRMMQSPSLSPRTREALQIYRTMIRDGNGAVSNDIKGYASMQMVGAGVTLLTSAASALANCVASALSAISMYAVWALAAMLIFSALFVLQESYSHLLIDAVVQYNSTYGPILYKVVLIPLQVRTQLLSCTQLQHVLHGT